MKRIIKVLTSSIIIGSIVFTAMLSTFAYTVNDVELVPITLSGQDYINMFNEGSFYAYYSFSSPTSVDITVFDMVQGYSSVVNIDNSGSNIYQVDNILISNQTNDNVTLVFSTRYAYNLRVNGNAELQSSLVAKLPFNYYLGGGNLIITSYISGTSTTSANITILFKNDNYTQRFNHSISPTIQYWASLQNLMQWYNQNNFSPYVPSGYTLDSTSTGIRAKYFYKIFSNVTTDELCNEINVTVYCDANHTSGTGYDYSFISPMIMYLALPRTVYVDPDIADTVEEYLDLIAGPMSPETEARIEDLKDEFEAQSDALHDAAEDIHKDMPTLPDVSGLPQEVTEGVQEATQYVITPLFGVGIVGTVVGTCLVFAVIKLLLYGSGPS